MILLTSELYYRFYDKVVFLELEIPARGWHTVLCFLQQQEMRSERTLTSNRNKISAILNFKEVSEPKKIK